LEEQIKTYESLVDGNFHCLKPKNIEEIPSILIAARLAQKMSQKDLADAIGIQEQQIQRYEASDYEAASWTRIVEVVLALNLHFYFEKIFIINSEEVKEIFKYPESYSYASIMLADEKIKKRHSLILE
jgi:HTH-type transcriptional regulator / antitoxin HipB